MVETILETLDIDDRSRRLTRRESGLIEAGAGKTFDFQLCRKTTRFGDWPVTQFWMDRRTIYPDRKRLAVNYRPLIEAYWALCFGAFTIIDAGVQDSYILVNLLPHVRSTGARRIVRDSVPNQSRRSRREACEDLEQLLSASRDKEMGIVEFRDSTADAIGPARFSEDEIAKYRGFSEAFLSEARDALERHGDPGLETALKHWQRWMTSVGRRRGRQSDKLLLDILSFECRAALHRCYSAVWDHLVFQLAHNHDLRHDEVVFHRFWHLDQMTTSDHPDVPFHLFHGHLFALHPGSAAFLQTPTGQALMGEWLAKPEDHLPRYRRLLHGLSVAVHHYAYDQQAAADARHAPEHTVGDIAVLEEQQYERRTGRRTKRPRRDA